MPPYPDPDPNAVPPARPRAERSWVQRAEGDRRAWARLRMLEGDGVIVLDDRRDPGSRTAIKKIAVSSGGVFVLDAKHYKGLVHTRRSGPISALGPDELHVGRRDCTEYVDEIARQMHVVRAALGDMSGGSAVPVQAMLCLTRAEWGVASAVEIRQVCVGWPQLIAGRVRAQGAMGPAAVNEVSAAIAELLPTA